MRRSALIVAHPGHELRVHRWLELVRPIVVVLTDGSGRTGRSRLPSTSRVLSAVGARPAEMFGRFTDAELYEMILHRDASALLAVMRELADLLRHLGIDDVVGDALEGFNPSHDLCRFLINGAVALLEKETGRCPENYDFLLDGSPVAMPHDHIDSVIRVELDDDALRRKLSAADDYVELRSETGAALTRFGRQAFATEVLRVVADRRQGLDQMELEPPFYESFGERQVEAGHYAHVLRYRTHVRPLVNELWRQADLDGAGEATTDNDTSAPTGSASASSHLIDS